MKKKNTIILFVGLILLVGGILLCLPNKKEEKLDTKKIEGTVLNVTENSLTIRTPKSGIYTFHKEELQASIGDKIALEYSGILNFDTNIQEGKIEEYTVSPSTNPLVNLPVEWTDEGLFKDYYEKAYQKLKTLSLDEKIGQLLLARFNEDTSLEDIKKYHLGGFVFFEKDFTNKTAEDIRTRSNNLQNASKIPLLTAVDEEGGKVVRISSNPNLVAEKFKSSKELYNEGGFPKIKEDTIEKSKILKNLGLNLNLAPVVDISTDPNDYMYERSFGKDASLTSTYAKTVIEASKGTSVSYTLKHFPGYGNNADTHTSSTTDDRTYESIINNDLLPFEAGIKSGAEAVLVSHNTVTSIDATNPASLSPSIHNLLRNRLDFTGIIITDDLDMGATKNIQNSTVKAILAGNDLIITTDYKTSFEEIKKALEQGTVSEDLINRIALRNIAWKYYKGLIYDNEK